MNYLQSSGNVSVCHKNNCVHATGRNARLIAFGVFALLLMIGISFLANLSGKH